MITIFY